MIFKPNQWVGATSSARNRRKRMKNKLKQKNRLMNSGCSSLYMFTSINTGGYVLFAIDFNKLDDDHDKKGALDKDDVCKLESTPLSPCLVFHPRDLPNDYCELVALGEYFYFVGQRPTEISMIKKFFIENLVSHETNLASLLLEPLNTYMKSPKSQPLVFAAKENLYVISREYSFTSYDFEMYSPVLNTWTTLKHKPHGCGDLVSFVVIGDTVYFATTSLNPGEDDSTVLSFHLNNETWNILSTSPSMDFSYNLRPAFDPRVLHIGELLFGGFRGDRTVGASPCQFTDDKSMFMRPSLAPTYQFWDEFTFRYECVCPFFGASYDMIAMQTVGREDVLCCVSYGISPSAGELVALFTFFKIPGTISEGCPQNELMDDSASSYYKIHPQKKFGTDSYFDSEFMHRKLFKLPSNKLRGKLISCFTY